MGDATAKSNTLRRFAAISPRNNAIGANDGQRPAQFVSDRFGGERLAAARRRAKQDAVAKLQSVRAQHLA